MPFWRKITGLWQQLDHQLRQAAIIYIVFMICVILFQVYINIARPGSAEAMAVSTAEIGTRAGAMHKVDLTDLCLELDQEMVAKLGFDQRSPGVAAIPAHHSWQIAVKQTQDAEWRWMESSHQYDLYDVSDSTARSAEDLRQAVLAVKNHWTESSGREVAESLSRENDMMVLNLELKLKAAEDESAPSLTMSRLQIRLKNAADVADTLGGMMDEGVVPEGVAAGVAGVAPPGFGIAPDAGKAPGNVTTPGTGTTPDKIPAPGVSIGDQPARPIRPKICIILDDGGEATPDVADEFWQLGSKWPLAMAVLPFSPFSHEQAVMANNYGYEVLLHLPMEPLGSENPGPGAIFTDLTDAEIRERVQAALDAVPGAIGVNNHMGSKASSDPRVMRLVLAEVRRNNLFFVDSVSIASTVGYQEAVRMGIPAARRQVFLDNVATEEAVLKQLEELVRVARSKGTAIGIGHFNRVATAQALARFLPRLEELGIELVALSEVIK